MTISKGFRKGTRSKFSRDYRRHYNLTSDIQRVYHAGDVVDVKVNGSIHKGMPHSFYHGRTGRIFTVNNNAVGIILTKPVGNKILNKRMYIRTEHIKPSRSHLTFKERVIANQTTRAAGERVAKRVNAQPKAAKVVADVKVTDATARGTF